MAHRLLRAADAFWRESNQMRVLNTDLGKQLEAGALGARMWRLRPGEASTKHRHQEQEELYVLLEGRGRIRIDEESLELVPLDALLVEPDSVRQVFNDTDVDVLWLVVGAPPEPANTLVSRPGFHGDLEARILRPRERRTSANASQKEIPRRVEGARRPPRA